MIGWFSGYAASIFKHGKTYRNKKLYELVSFRVKEIVVANIGHDHLLSFYVARLHFTADLLEDNYYSVCTATTVITL